MRHFMLLLGMGTALLGTACRAKPETPLAAAAAANDVDAVRRLLADGRAPDEDDSGLTPLMWAARTGATGAMQLLLDGGAVSDRRDRRNGWTALQHAIHKSQAGAVQLLLDRGADPNGADHPGALTPLLMASLDSDPSIVRLLLAYGANPRVAGEHGDTPLTRAVSGGALADIDRPLAGKCHAHTVRALLEHDPALRLPDSFSGRLALWWARVHVLGESDDPDRCADVRQLVGDRKRVGLIGATEELVSAREAANRRR